MMTFDSPEESLAHYEQELQDNLNKKIQLTVDRFRAWKQEDPATRGYWLEVFEEFCKEIGWDA